MAISLIFIGLLTSIFLLLSSENIRVSLLKGVLSFSLFTLLFTECLSLFNTLNYLSLVCGWSIVDVVLIYFIIKSKPLDKFNSIKIKVVNGFQKMSRLEWFLIGFSIFVLLGIFIQGLTYPSNNWDSMTYHMARIVHWIKNESLMYFRTPVYSQVNSPPFAEQLILNINVLAENDYFSNAVQCFYLGASGIVISLISKLLGLNRLGQILAVFMLFCLPEAILLGSSTHTELVLSFFMLSSIYFLIKTLKYQTLISFVFLGCSLGLAVCTKTTAYLYLAPFVLIWFVYQAYHVMTKNFQFKWWNYILTLLIFVIINGGHYTRNYYATNTVFGTDSSIDNYYVNEEHSVKMLISNVSRNMSSQFGVPKIAPIVENLTKELHLLLELDVDDPKTTSHRYRIDPLATHENNGANFLHMILILMSSIWLLSVALKKDIRLTLYWGAIVLSFLLFCFYLKWQPWAKLHIPFFIFYSIVFADFLIKKVKSKILFSIVISGVSFYAVLILLFNYSRPFISLPPYTTEIKITDDRYKKYFSRFLPYHNDYKLVSEKIINENFKNIGLEFGEYNMEYQLFLSTYQRELNPIHINSCGLTAGIPIRDSVDCIVSTESTDFIEHNGNVFYNATEENKGNLYLFLKK